MKLSLIKASWYGIGLTTAFTAIGSERMEDGRRAYEAACANCHQSETSDAPQTGTPEDWSGRSPLWETVLLEHARKGYLGMPAKGGSGLSDYETEAAAEYMLNSAHPDLPED